MQRTSWLFLVTGALVLFLLAKNLIIFAWANNINLAFLVKDGQHTRPSEAQMTQFTQLGAGNLQAELTVIRYYVMQGQLRLALDYLENRAMAAQRLVVEPEPMRDPVHSTGLHCSSALSTNVDSRTGLCEPALALGMKARRLAAAQAWPEAVAAYRELLLRSPGNLVDDMLPVYHLALAQLYKLQSRPDAAWRRALHLWRAGYPEDAQNALAEVGAYDPEKVEAYRNLWSAESKLRDEQRDGALLDLQVIPSTVPDAWLRAQFALSKLDTTPVSLNRIAKRIDTFVPMILVNQDVDGIGRLDGIEILEPEILDDGGLLSLALFWSELSDPSHCDQQSWLCLNNQKAIQLLTTRNLVPDPGFAWQTDQQIALGTNIRANPGYWVQGFGYPQPPEAWRFVTEKRAGQLTTVSCLDNDPITDERKLAGLQTWFFFIMPDTYYIQLGWLRSQRNPSNALLGVYWDSGDVSVIASAPQHEEWRPYAGVLRSPNDARSATIMLQNTGVTGAVCFDDIALVRWSE